MKIDKEKIRHLVRKNSFKQKEVAIKIGVAPQDWNNWMYRGVFPHYEKIEELAQVLCVNVSEILAENEFQEPILFYKNKKTNPVKEIIPFYNFNNQKDLNNFWNDETTSEPEDHIYLPGLKASFILPFFGKGMDPTLNNGDWIALRRIHDTSFYNYGSIHLIITEEQVIMRYLKPSTLKKHILLVAENELYDSINLPIKAVKSVFILVATLKRETL